MSIKYGDLTIIKELPKSIGWLNWLTNEEHSETKSKYIFLFDDGEICDLEGKLLVDFNFNFLSSLLLSVLPLYFEKKIKKESQIHKIYFKKEINTKTLDSLLCFNQLFVSYSKYKCDMNIQSEYNGIYDCHKTSVKPEIFGLVRIKSTEQMPRYQFAYDSDEFTKEEIIYLIHYIFNS